MALRAKEFQATMPRLGFVEPLEQESISHYLGRLRRFKANSLPSGHALGQLIGVGSAVSRWEKLYFNPFPEEAALIALAGLCGIDVERLQAMLPEKGRSMQPRPILLCGACYGESPCHRMVWQYKAEEPVCNRHHLKLLSKCPCCKHPFQLPSQWETGTCHHCGMPFQSMGKKQKRFRAMSIT
jgi:hypothetical protein